MRSKPGSRLKSSLSQMALMIFALVTLCSSTGCTLLTSRPDVVAAVPRTLEMVDPARSRRIPVTLFGGNDGHARPLAIFSPGYGSATTDYRFLTDTLVDHGYVVASIQQVLPDDPPMPSGDNLAVRRRPFWDDGVASIRFVAGDLRRRRIASSDPLILAGHSNGGDISMLFAAQFPSEARAVFTLDNRRMPLPRISRPRLCSIRSSDHPADAGVIPTRAEQDRHGMIISTIGGLRHDDMWDGATPDRKLAMKERLLNCIRDMVPRRKS